METAEKSRQELQQRLLQVTHRLNELGSLDAESLAEQPSAIAEVRGLQRELREVSRALAPLKSSGS